MAKSRLLRQLMKGLSRLAKHGLLSPSARGLPPPRPPAPELTPAAGREDAPGGGQFLSGEHVGAHGRRRYRLYLPPGREGQALPLILMLHGCKQDPEDFAAGTRMNELAREQGCCVLYPAQSRRANPMRCWNWFQPQHQQRGRGEPALLAEMTQQVMAQYHIDPLRVYVAGLSAGGSMGAILAHAYPELFAALGVHSGVPRGAAHNVPSAFAVMRDGMPSRQDFPGVGSSRATPPLPTIVLHGERDDTVHPLNARRLIEAVVGLEASEQLERHASHSCTRYLSPQGAVLAEFWVLHEGGHAWSGGSPQGSYTEPQGIDASREMLRFFMAHPKPAASL